MGDTEEAITLKIILIGMAVLFLLSLSVIVFFILYQRRLLAQQKKHQKLESDYQKELLKTSIISQEKERSRIAKELHDDVGAMLITTKLYFDQITPGLKEEEITDITSRVKGFFEDMLGSIRSISQDLRPVVLENLGLIEALESLMETLNDSGKINIYFTNNTVSHISKLKELNIYRIIQELITNTLKHAEATVIKIELRQQEDVLLIFYEDNGKGIHKENLRHKKGLGLKNIESRLSVLSGKIKFQEKSKGLNIKMEIPM
ncbi:sensor histidine kinase [Abyssalbus ytuae]|uniref:histidine kinase n=1 Tax=Abyssalbus ytuae TaxID=2926907 RepID=A0A9E7CUY1_9FLAO|nr:ATP-binding protein [Abyssalbus ytuae]UOB19122.1 histidine kinase [Abyssalbus ytuae]